MASNNILLMLILGGSLAIVTSYAYATTFTDITVTPGVSTFENDLVFDRSSADNSIVQGQNAYDNNRDLFYQKAGGGPMSGFKVSANKMSLTGGPVGIGTQTPTSGYAVDVNGAARFNNDLVFDRSDFDNSIVQGTAAYNNNRDLVYQREGGGPMSGFIVSANKITLQSTGDICIGTCPP
jgi:hypothetical protein